LFVGATIYSSRTNLVLLYQKTNEFLQEKIAGITRGNILIPDFIEKEKETSSQKETITPGPLVANNPEDNYLENENIILASLGVLSYTNEERTKAGLLPLTVNTKLVNSASYKTSDLFNQQYFEHEAPNGEAVAEVTSKFGYEYILVGENLALGNFDSNKKLVDAWMASPGHRANILNKNYTEIGISVKRDIYEGKLLWIAVQHFGTPSSSCPEIDIDNKINIKTGEGKLSIKLNDLNNKKTEIGEMEPTNPEYRPKVDAYNELVLSYNKLVAETKEMIKEYNSEVVLFNECIKGLTS